MRVLRPPIVLLYHGIGYAAPESDPLRLLTTPEYLREHIGLLRDWGYRFVGASALSGQPMRPRTAVLTFDDGWGNWLSRAVPALQELEVIGTFFVCPGLWGGEHLYVTGSEARLLTENETRDLALAGMEIGSHAMSHADLTTLSPFELELETLESKREIERVTGQPCGAFAYPYGIYNRRVVDAVREAGYEVAFASDPGRWEPFAMPRMHAPPRHGKYCLALKMLHVRRHTLRKHGMDRDSGLKIRAG